MSLSTPTLTRNGPFRFVKQSLGNPFLSLRSIPFLIVLVSSLAILPAVRADVLNPIPVDAPGSLGSIVASPNRTEVYVADAASHRIAVIDTISNQIKSFIATANSPVGLGVSPDGNTLYVTEGLTAPPFTGFLEAISLTSFSQLFIVTVGTSPGLPGVSSDGSTVYVPSTSSPGTVSPVGGPLTGSTITVGGRAAEVVFNQSNTKAYVSNETKKIVIIHTATGAVTKIATASPTDGLAILGTTLFATSRNSKVFVIDTNSNTVIDTIKVPTPATGNFVLGFPALTPDGAFLYVPVTEQIGSPPVFGNTVVVINTKTNKVEGQPIKVGQVPFQVAIGADDTYGYSSNNVDGTVSVFGLLHLPPF
jgi:YVTN family beta-propeller protein